MTTHPNNRNRLELHQFAADSGLTPEQVRAELASGRLAFEIAETGQVFTDRFAVLDWISRRISALSMFGADKVQFPLYKCDWRALEDIRDRPEVGFAEVKGGDDGR